MNEENEKRVKESIDRLERDAARAELTALKERIEALADEYAAGDQYTRWIADDLRDLLSSDGTAVRADDRAGEGS